MSLLELLEPDYQAALSQEDSEQPSASVRFGEMSPGTLEQGGVSAEAENPVNLFVASPFHSEKVKSEVELLRSRPATLDDDGRRAGIEYDEVALGDSSFSSGGREPDYNLAGQGLRGGAPRLARVEIAGESAAERAVVAEEPKPGVVEVQQETGRGWEVAGKGRGTNPGEGAGPASTFAGEQLGASDPRELIPDSGFFQGGTDDVADDAGECGPSAETGGCGVSVKRLEWRNLCDSVRNSSQLANVLRWECTECE